MKGLKNVIPICAPTKKVPEDLLLDEFGSVTICYFDSDSDELLTEADLEDPIEVKVKAWEKLRVGGCKLKNLYKDIDIEVPKAPAYTVKAPFGFDTITLAWVASMWHEDVIYIIPATRKEVILLAGSEISSGHTTEERIKEMVRDNNRQLFEADANLFLSDDVFCYENASRKLRRVV